MRRTQPGFLMFLCLLIVAFVAAGAYLPAGKLLAMQGGTGTGTTGSSTGSTGAGSNTGAGVNSGSRQDTGAGQNNGTSGSGMNNGATGDNSRYGGSDTSNQSGTSNMNSGAQGTNTSGQGQDSTNMQGTTGQAGNQGASTPITGTSRAAIPWGWIIGSFIVGMIVGGLAFRGRPSMEYRDRDDFRRAA